MVPRAATRSAAGEDFLGILLVRWLFRHSGAFFIRRSFSGDELYSAVFDKYIEQLLVDGQSIEFFIEGTRSRSGKMLPPKMGLLSVVTQAFLDKKIPDATIVPISINYEKVRGTHFFSFFLLFFLLCFGVVWCGVVCCVALCCGGVLWCGVVWCAALWYAVLCSAMLCCAVVSCAVLC